MLRSWSLKLTITETSGLPVYLQIAQQIMEEIQRGRLAPSTAMPGTRELAEKLKVNRKTVILAYDELIAQGWLVTEQRRGSFVSANLPNFNVLPQTSKTSKQPANVVEGPTHPLLNYQSPEAGVIDFNDGIPDSRLIPFNILSRAFRHALIGSSKNLGYGDPRGTLALRQSIATMLNMERGLSVAIDQICIARGSQMGIFLAARVLTRPNDAIVVEQLSYPAAKEAFRSCGANILTVGQDKHGIDVAALEKLCKQHPIRAIYVTPHHQFPTTVMMTAERRLKLLMLAEQYDFTIVEDDYDHEFHFSHHPVFPLASSNHGGRVIYVGSLSKVLAPGLRVGYLVATPGLIDRCAKEVMLIDRQGNSITELAVAELMNSGEIKRHIRKTFKIYHERRNLLISLIEKELHQYIEYDAPDGGLAVWLRLKEGYDVEGLAQQALKHHIRILPGSLFSESQRSVHAIRLGFGSLTSAELEKGVMALKAAFSSDSNR
ncbi:MocR-like pyridoxine biosynthesis transcription factor PdxR [Methylophilus aquaticus]|uniref:PLP-dependent aminotransferase family protein n=1 Tax=Methylophilus aquaticus TaxID=1971610 RepID=A0ABT9JQC8_9PROT|nr:PLP-dependent aminotransferase family protein [Methylophilus aquaticus]MDP8566760.1 PLP-dependent aminotransferase family protein [Methylophilus aquaticus]